MVARGAAYGDYDGDGDPDLLVTTNNGPAALFRNDGAAGHRALRIALRGTASNRDGIGARVAIRMADGSRRWQMVKTGSSYLSQSEVPITFGLGRAQGVEAIEIAWPSGRIDRLAGEKAEQSLIIEEGRGIAARTDLK
jgi:hypothetical protein